ncbi:MAG: MMPL family transporter [Deltaproteobacteria bacterium]|nr:MMPL family transporter [Deltaproteobacteria bacterium]
MAGSQEKGTLRFARFVVSARLPIAVLLALATLFFLYPSVNAVSTLLGAPLPGPSIGIGSDARDLVPDHPFIHAQDKFAGEFGNSTLVAIVLVRKDGSLFTPEGLARIDRVTKSLNGDDFPPNMDERRALRLELEAEDRLSRQEIAAAVNRAHPPYPVNHDQIRSLVHLTTRVLEREPDGTLEINLLVEDLPETQEEADEIRDTVFHKVPEFLGVLVSRDERAALIMAGFVTDRLDSAQVYRAIFDHLQRLKEREQDDEYEVYITGVPLVVGWIIAHSWEILVSVVGAVGAIFLLLWAYFRRAHGVIIPFLCAGVTVIWGTGFTGWMGIQFNPLVLVIPMIITARAVSHTVQMAERFFEDYERLYPLYDDPEQAKIEAVTVALSELIVPGTLGVVTDVAGLLVILVTSLPAMWDLGLFGAFWVASIVVTVEILHPILICVLPPPRDPVHYTPTFMSRLLALVGRVTTDPVGKRVIAVATILMFLGSAWVTLMYSRIGESRPGVPIFWPDHPFNVATGKIGEHFGGADTLMVYADGDRDGVVGEGEVLQKMEMLSRKLQRESGAHAVLSLTQVVKTANSLLRSGDPKHEVIPDQTRGIVTFVRFNAPGGSLGSIVNTNGRAGALTAFYPDHKGDTIRRAVEVAEEFIAANPIGLVSVRLEKNRGEPDAPFWNGERLADFVYYMLGPLLPDRSHTLRVRLRGERDEYVEQPVQNVGQDGLPPWIGEFREAALAEYARARDGVPPGRLFTWPDSLEDWDEDDVDQWWEDEELALRAVAVSTRNLLVQDAKAQDDAPKFQLTNSWTRGVQFVMAGGVIGMLAAVNEEVERSHLANISLIFLVIFVLHSFTYRSMPSGAIILLQISTATLLSLAYMALLGVGLNVNTLPVQAVGVGIGVDYAIYIVDRIRQEVRHAGDIDEAIRRAVQTTGMAVSFTATTVVGGIFFWVFSSLRFQAEMAQLLIVLMVINMLGAIIMVPAFYSIFRPRAAMRMLQSSDSD